MKTVVVIPNWNGEEYLRECIDSLLNQSVKSTIVVVDNGSSDASREILEAYGKKIVRIYREKNYGFTGGVNPGIKYAMENDFDAVALLNNDAVADKDWLNHLVSEIRGEIGIVTCSLQTYDKKHMDSTGESMTTWGLPYPRGRDSAAGDSMSEKEFIFGASGGASLYSIPMFREVGIFDDDFFAYYEDVDVSFRAQLAGWKALYVPKAVAYHRIGKTSERIKGFTVYHTFKNLPLVTFKNVPKGLRHVIYPRFMLAYTFFFFSALTRGDGWIALKGFGKFLSLIPKKSRERKEIQSKKKVDNAYINSILTHDLPENSARLRKLRSMWWKLRGKKS